VAGPSGAVLGGTVEGTERVDDETVLDETAVAFCVPVGNTDLLDEPQPTRRHITTAAPT
jgi:hypothetical protein